MIERFYLKNYLSFDEVDLEFQNTLIVFSGPSGAGKSILSEAILAIFGLKETNASLIEASINAHIGLDEFGIEEEEPNVFKFLKGEKSRYFINNQIVSKKNIKNISTKFIKYLTLREFSEFENPNLLKLIDAIALQNDKKYKNIQDEFLRIYKNYTNIAQKLYKLEEEERKVEELKEFTKYEISKIDEINPKIGEYEELLELKKSLSKKEKIEESIMSAKAIFDLENSVSQALNLLEKDSTFFDESMNELREIFESANDKLDELEEVDIESLLDRIEKISSLIRRYDSIENCLEYRDKKQKELEYYENLEFEKKTLIKEKKELEDKVSLLADEISKNRKKAISILQDRINHYLKMLYLNKVTLSLQDIPLTQTGKDFINLELDRIDLKKISSGELNRVRVAFLAASNEFVQENGGVLILDEIDANLSGKESMSVAKVLKLLSNQYQIFAISHQSQLSSFANMHFLVTKSNGKSIVKLLENEDRIKELSRMISGENITKEAIDFAKSLLNKKN